MGTVRYTVVNGEVIAEKRDGVRKFYRSDANGNVIGLYNDSQQLTDTFKYWPFGELRERTGSTPTPFQFGGALGCRTSADGTVYMRARDTQPKNARFLTVDPYWPSQPAYSYCLSNPTTFFDPSGLKVIYCYRPVAGSWLEGHCHPWLRTDECGAIGQTGKEIGIVVGSVDDPLREDPGYSERINAGGCEKPRCRDLNLTPEQEKCLCEKAINARKGWILCGIRWLPRDYSWYSCNSQHFIIALLYKCTGDKKYLDLPHVDGLPFDPEDCFRQRTQG